MVDVVNLVEIGEVGTRGAKERGEGDNVTVLPE
jgi:hypothetical protein